VSIQIWTPGMAGPLEAFVERLQRRVEAFAERRGWAQAWVEIEFIDGSTVSVHSISAEPGFGFVTICPYPEDEEQAWPAPGGTDDAVPPEELIVPIGSIKRITLAAAAEQRSDFGFAVPPA
jgi:hypothetical protein